jgi:hypothetical protein
MVAVDQHRGQLSRVLVPSRDQRAARNRTQDLCRLRRRLSPVVRPIAGFFNALSGIALFPRLR